MAVRGRKPTAPVLKLVTGNPGKRPLPNAEPVAEGRPIRPPKIRGRAAALWDELVAAAWWLGAVDGYKLHLWCELQAQFEGRPRSMNAARLAQLRAVGSELGLDVAARNRIGAGEKADGKEKDPAAKYF